MCAALCTQAGARAGSLRLSIPAQLCGVPNRAALARRRPLRVMHSTRRATRRHRFRGLVPGWRAAFAARMLSPHSASRPIAHETCTPARSGWAGAACVAPLSALVAAFVRSLIVCPRAPQGRLLFYPDLVPQQMRTASDVGFDWLSGVEIGIAGKYCTHSACNCLWALRPLERRPFHRSFVQAMLIGSTCGAGWPAGPVYSARQPHFPSVCASSLLCVVFVSDQSDRFRESLFRESLCVPHGCRWPEESSGCQRVRWSN